MKNIGPYDPCPCGSGKKHKFCCLGKSAAPASPRSPLANAAALPLPAMFGQAVAHHQQGRLDAAAALYRQILELAPGHADALHLSGVIALQKGQPAAAVDLIRKALRIRQSEHYYSNLGNALKDLGQLPEAVEAYRQALAVRPDLAIAHCNLGHALMLLGRLDESVAACRQALAIQPDFAEALANLGNALGQQGRLEEAIDCYRQALARNPQLAEVHGNLGNAYLLQGRHDDAIAACQRALQLDPRFAAAYSHLGKAFAARGRIEQAIDCFLRALQVGDNLLTRSDFVGSIRQVHFQAPHAVAREYVLRALTEAWVRPGDLLTPALSLVETNPVVRDCLARAVQAWPQFLDRPALFGAAGLRPVAEDALLLCLLENVAINSMAFERLLTMTRRILLEEAIAALASPAAGDAVLMDFYCALARQCFINEYVYDCSAEDDAKLSALWQQVRDRADTQAPVPPACLAALGAFLPLGTLDGIDTLLARPWPAAVQALLRQQVIEPRTERDLQAAMPRLTAIGNGVSRSVQAQYEENPYPRWVQVPCSVQAAGVDEVLRHLMPDAHFDALGKTDALEVLVAGCGTGQHAIETARQFSGANVLAIDLSLASLAYAQRKTEELGLANIAYAQADILQLGALGQTFDVIESVGVLHHLESPLAGWQVLCDLLRPGGLMCIGLYSALARQDIVAARAHIAAQGYAANARDIRRCRQDLMAGAMAPRPAQFLSSRDFFSMSDCRDLLFHVQEHRFTIAQLRDMIAALDLHFIGFMLDPAVAQRYAQQFPDDRARTDLDNWQAFEAAHPDTFARMYQFWVQKRANPSGT